MVVFLCVFVQLVQVLQMIVNGCFDRITWNRCSISTFMLRYTLDVSSWNQGEFLKKNRRHLRQDCTSNAESGCFHFSNLIQSNIYFHKLNFISIYKIYMYLK